MTRLVLLLTCLTLIGCETANAASTEPVNADSNNEACRRYGHHLPRTFSSRDCDYCRGWQSYHSIDVRLEDYLSYSTSTERVTIDWPKFCARFGHCWEFKSCLHAVPGPCCSHYECKHCGASAPNPRHEWKIGPSPSDKVYPLDGRDPRKEKP